MPLGGTPKTDNPPREGRDHPERRRPDEDPKGANPDTGEAPGVDEQQDPDVEDPPAGAEEETTGPPPESVPGDAPGDVPSPK